jgi:hypothetical protein
MSKPNCLEPEGAILTINHGIIRSHQNRIMVGVFTHKMFNSSLGKHETPVIVAKTPIQSSMHNPASSAVALPGKFSSKGAYINKPTSINVPAKDISLS